MDVNFVWHGKKRKKSFVNIPKFVWITELICCFADFVNITFFD